ncbi:hypothetical protein SDC9_196507 [bioreactor metagenome]|uniref:Uncharacterized protein n=1 Tax=bioreactor metagenome TaxID=1076179 RepID=A0A645IC81_9ZZZZ
MSRVNENTGGAVNRYNVFDKELADFVQTHSGIERDQRYPAFLLFDRCFQVGRYRDAFQFDKYFFKLNIAIYFSSTVCRRLLFHFYVENRGVGYSFLVFDAPCEKASKDGEVIVDRCNIQPLIQGNVHLQ